MPPRDRWMTLDRFGYATIRMRSNLAVSRAPGKRNYLDSSVLSWLFLQRHDEGCNRPLRGARFLPGLPVVARRDAEAAAEGVVEIGNVTEADEVGDLGDALVRGGDELGRFVETPRQDDVADGLLHRLFEEMLQPRRVQVHRGRQILDAVIAPPL